MPRIKESTKSIKGEKKNKPAVKKSVVKKKEVKNIKVSTKTTSGDVSGLVKEILTEIFSLMELPVEVEIVVGQEGGITAQLNTADPGLLIGYHGQNLHAIQHLLNLMIFRKTNEWRRIIVNVNDYWQKRQETLEAMALSIAQKVKFSGEPQSFPPMASAERRIIHIFLAEDPEIETISEGEGKDRCVVVKLKK